MSIETIQRRTGKRYRVRVMRDGKPFSQTFHRFYDAEQFLKKVEEGNELLAESDLTFEQAANQWMQSHAEVYKAPASIKSDRWMLAAHILPVLGKCKLRKLSARQVEDLITSLRKLKIASSSVKRNLAVVSAILNYFIRRRVLAYNPMCAISRIKMEDVDIHFWSHEEANRFLQHAETKYRGTRHHVFYLFYKVALHTGMRLGELLALKWSAVDFQSRSIKVCRSYCDVSKDIRETTKSRKIRHIPLGEGIYDDLLKAREGRGEVDFVFHLNGEILDKSNLRNRHFNKDMEASGVSRIRIHDMRHTYASHFMMNGGNIYHLQAILGHSDMKMTQRYAHFSKNYFNEKADIVRFGSGQVIKVDFGQKTGTEAV